MWFIGTVLEGRINGHQQQRPQAIPQGGNLARGGKTHRGFLAALAFFGAVSRLYGATFSSVSTLGHIFRMFCMS